MKKVPQETAIRKAEDDVFQLSLAGVVRRGLLELVFNAGTNLGHVPGNLVLGGRLVQARRPMARTLDGRDVVLPSWAEFRRENPLTDRAVEQIMLGWRPGRTNGC